jgi:hypothetical protein
MTVDTSDTATGNMITLMEVKPNVITNGYGSEKDDDPEGLNSEERSESTGTMDRATSTPSSAEVIAKDEDKAVFRLRLILLMVLIGSTIGTSFATWHYIRLVETSAFEQRFQADATKVLSSVGASLDLTMAAVDSLVVNMVSYAHQDNKNIGHSSGSATTTTWPFVTIPDFAVRAAKTKALSNAIVMSLYTVVTSDDRLEWENYTLEHNSWVNESLILHESDESYQGPINYNWTEFPDLDSIVGSFGYRPYNYSTYLPQWQTYPVVTTWNPYNWDLLSDSSFTSLEDDFGNHKVILAPAYQLPDPDDPVQVAETQAFTSFFADLVQPDQDPSQPVSDLYYPVIDSATSSVWTPSDPTDEKNKLVGIMALSIFWADAIKEVRIVQAFCRLSKRRPSFPRCFPKILSASFWCRCC